MDLLTNHIYVTTKNAKLRSSQYWKPEENNPGAPLRCRFIVAINWCLLDTDMFGDLTHCTF